MLVGFPWGNDNKLFFLSSLLIVLKYHHWDFSDNLTNTGLYFTLLFSVEKGVSCEVWTK